MKIVQQLDHVVLVDVDQDDDVKTAVVDGEQPVCVVAVGELSLPNLPAVSVLSVFGVLV